ncbi:hypothetical protein XELAEV_18022006mg [Xenopus laevis]|uniref:Uncharacterized protein n=1 Tax=Xenopus laevis TaxID=8355 RepID=A0A974HMS3_XENLA|nr:hypothetical protein XELAEV_18022006mg [Xenopus laevis]
MFIVQRFSCYSCYQPRQLRRNPSPNLRAPLCRTSILHFNKALLSTLLQLSCKSQRPNPYKGYIFMHGNYEINILKEQGALLSTQMENSKLGQLVEMCLGCYMGCILCQWRSTQNGHCCLSWT